MKFLISTLIPGFVIKCLFFLCSLGLGIPAIVAQVFKAVPGAISSVSSDSRSVNFLDLNNDGWEDVYISNGLKGGQQDLLYINDGTGQFTRVTDMDIVTASNPSDGASFADYNNDGHLDGVISSWYGAEDLLYLNDGSGNLQYKANAGIAPGSFAETAAFGDYDNDGLLDLYITNSGGGKTNYLYRNLGDGTFEWIKDHVLVKETKLSRGAVWVDINNDGITDLFVANESKASNDIYLGKGGDEYEKFGSGSIVVKSMGSMTGSWGDIDNDGDFDLFVGNAGFFTKERNQLYKNFGNSFAELTEGPVVEEESCTYGSAFGDYDNDGDLDLITTQGFCNSGLRNNLYENQGDGTFTDVSNLLAVNSNICSFGVAWGDVNNDGFLDLVVANCKNNEADSEKSNTLLINQGNDNHWLEVKLNGVQSNTSAMGAKVKVKATIDGNTVWQVREIRSQSGYAGQNSLVAHFGLKGATLVDSLLVFWPAGGVQVLQNIEVDQKLNLLENVINKVRDETLAKFIQLDVFPNPINLKFDSLQISINNLEGSTKGQVFLHDPLGRVVWRKNIDILNGASKLATPLLINDLSPGVYQLSLQVGSGLISRKLVFQ